MVAALATEPIQVFRSGKSKPDGWAVPQPTAGSTAAEWVRPEPQREVRDVVQQWAPSHRHEACLILEPSPAERFDTLAEQWQQETKYLSSATDIIFRPAYQQIIGMGREALPLILSRLSQTTDHWFWALYAITGENPVPDEDAGDMERMRWHWLKLAYDRGWLE